MNDPTANISKFFGLRNKDQPRRLPIGSLLKAENVDIDNQNGIVQRPGYISILGFTNIVSIFTTQDQKRCFVVSDGNLHLVKDDLSQTLLASGLSDDYIYWVEQSDFVFLSTGHLIHIDNTITTWKIPNPNLVEYTTASGNLKAGRYSLCCTFSDSKGREGGASDIITIELNSDESSIIVTPEYINTLVVNFYITDLNGSVFYNAGWLSSGSMVIDQTDNLSIPIDAYQLASYPAPNNTHQIAFYENKLFASERIGNESFIWFSKPFWWNLFDLQNDYIRIDGLVKALIGTKQGLIICTNDEIWIYSDAQMVRVAEYGVPSGKPFAVDDYGTVFIQTNQGVCSLFPFTNLTEQKVSLPPGEFCDVSIVEQDGIKKLVVLTDGLGISDNPY